MNIMSHLSVYRSILLTASTTLFLFGANLIVTPNSWAEPPWDSMVPTKFSVTQAVKADGASAWTISTWGTGYEQGYKLIGVVLNNPADMLDSTANYNTTPWDLGGQWQVFVQTIDSTDFGGAALYMAQNYGNLGFINNSSYNYSNDAWNAEIARVSLNNTLQAGDVIEVDARGGLFYNGKFNVNEQHDNDPIYNFDVKLISHSSLPNPTLITLADVKNSDGTFKFVQDRSSGAEHYQSTLVRLDNMSLVDPADWKPNSTVTITDGTLTLPMLLGLNGFDGVAPPTGPFNVVGIFDQDSPNYTSGYYLWVNDASQFAAVPEPSGITLLIVMALCMGTLKLRKRHLKA